MNENKDILSDATEQMKNQQIPQGPSDKLIQETKALVEDSKQGDKEKHSHIYDITKFLNLVTRHTPKFAAAAVFLILAGYAVGRISAYKPVDEERLSLNISTALRKTLEPEIRQELLEEMDRQQQRAFTLIYDQLSNELDQRYRRDLTQFAAQTLAAVNTAQTQEFGRILETIYQVEANRQQDRAVLSSGLETLASQTQSSLKQTRQDFLQLLTNNQSDLPRRIRNGTADDETTERNDQ